MANADALPVAVLKAPPEERVPAIVGLDFLPDMGRMTARLCYRARISCSLVRIPVASAQPPCTRCWKPPSSMA